MNTDLSSNGKRHFKRAYVVQNTGHDFSGLREIADEIIFVTSGYEDERQLQQTIIRSLNMFNPVTDILVPVGNVYVNLLVGTVLAAVCTPWDNYQAALFREKEYHIREVKVEGCVNANPTAV